MGRLYNKYKQNNNYVVHLISSSIILKFGQITGVQEKLDTTCK
jgi:hypothetical protein